MRWRRLFVMTVIPLFLTGCWDRTELNDLAFNMGIGMDITDKGIYTVSAQIAVPSRLSGSPEGGGGGQAKGYLVVTGRGSDTRSAIQDMQEKISRRIHEGHRRVIFIGENMARKGIFGIIDTNTRDAETRLRTDIFVVKGGEASSVLQVYYPFERVPVQGAIKLHQVNGATADASFRDFLMKALDGSSSPTIPVLEEYKESSEDKGGFRFSGRAIFNKNMKLIGFLDTSQTLYRAWITGQTNRLVITMPKPDGKGQITLQLTQLHHKITPVLQKGRILIDVSLSGTGDVRENTTNIDLTRPDNLRKVESLFNHYSATEVQNVVLLAQKQYGADIFGFGQAIHHRYPYQWRSLKGRWDREFPNIEVVVHSKLTIQRIGLTTSFLQLSEGGQE